jgi:FAD synthetase
MVAALDPVDEAVVGSEESIFEPLYEIEPDVVTLGHDQNYAVEDLEDELQERGFDAEVVRVDARAEDDMVVSTSAIVERILERRG